MIREIDYDAAQWLAEMRYENQQDFNKVDVIFHLAGVAFAHNPVAYGYFLTCLRNQEDLEPLTASYRPEDSV